MERPRLEVRIFQIADDAVLKANRADGTGWDWCWADWRRDWMDSTPNRYAYRCLPLTIANQTGWWVKNPVGFTATWRGGREPGGVDFRFDSDPDFWKVWVNSQFGEGIITWNTPFLFRTRPEGSRLLVLGPANYFKENAHPLTALIESDWISMSFTMNWRLMTPDVPVRWEAGEPLFQAVPLAGNACADLEGASVTYERLADDPEISRSYHDWQAGRNRFHDQKARGEVKPDDWQKDYFQGRDVSGRPAAPEHMTKVKAPTIVFPRDPGRPQPGADRAAPQARAAKPGRPADARQVPAPEAPLFTTRTQVTQAGVLVEGAAGAPAARPAAPAPAAARRVDDEWRRWVAENLMLGSAAADLARTMAENGFAPADAVREVEAAARSPYLKGAERLGNRLRKRDWLLATYRKLRRLHPDAGVIGRKHRLPRAEFFADYYAANRPVIITGMMDDWPALRRWGLDDFAARFGDRVVEVQMGRDAAAGNYEIEREKFARTLTFADYIARVKASGVTNDFYLTANNNSSNKAALAGLWDDVVPLAEYLDTRDPLAGFFWLGPAGTVTPFHHDLTNNFMAQVVGRKRVKVAPSWDMPLMANDYHVFSRVDGRTTPAAPSPPADRPQVLECVLNPGEILFLPVGCLHYVESLDVSVTMSFTNFLLDNDFATFYTTYQGV